MPHVFLHALMSVTALRSGPAVPPVHQSWSDTVMSGGDIFNRVRPGPRQAQSQGEWRRVRLTDQQWQELMCLHKNTDRSLIQSNPPETASRMGLISEQSEGQNHNDISEAFSLEAEERIITEEETNAKSWVLFKYTPCKLVLLGEVRLDYRVDHLLASRMMLETAGCVAELQRSASVHLVSLWYCDRAGIVRISHKAAQQAQELSKAILLIWFIYRQLCS